MTTSDGTTYAYDANGNTTSSSDGWRFTYNAVNQTTSIQAPGRPNPEPIRFLGAGQSEMIERGGAPYRYSLLGLARKATEAYVREPDGQLHSQTAGGSRAYYLHDHHPGSVIALIDGAGSTVASYRYDPFGAARGTTGSQANSLRYAAGEYSEELKLYKYGERFYDPALGRWTQQDPLSQPYDPGEANRYAYVGGDPINLLDPSGLHGRGTNGCSYSPDYPYGFAFHRSCDGHDLCYAAQRGRLFCDRGFYASLLSRCYRYDESIRGRCYYIAYVYYAVVRKYGGRAYRNA
jgi:RHS repeat-associated protein